MDSLVLAPPTDEMFIFKTPRGQQHKTEYDRYQCRNLALSLAPREQLSETCQRYICPVAAAIMNKTSSCECDPTGSVSGICNVKGGQCECKPHVVGRKCNQCAVGTYGFGPSGCSECACDSVGSLNNNCDKQSGQCTCREKVREYLNTLESSEYYKREGAKHSNFRVSTVASVTSASRASGVSPTAASANVTTTRTSVTRRREPVSSVRT